MSALIGIISEIWQDGYRKGDLRENVDIKDVKIWFLRWERRLEREMKRMGEETKGLKLKELLKDKKFRREYYKELQKQRKRR